MPCHDFGADADDARESHERRDELACLLCAVCDAADRHDMPLPKEVEKWWRKHQKDDRKEREAEARAKAEAEKSRKEKLRAEARRVAEALAELPDDELAECGLRRQSLHNRRKAK